MKKGNFSSWVAFFVKLGLVVSVATSLSFLLFTLANFSDSAKRLSFYIKTTDAEMTKRELIGLHYFYDLSRKWKVQWLADKYLFTNALFYETADSYLIRDWKTVQEGLREKLEDPRAYPYGNAKFREKQALFQKKSVKIEEALDFVMKEVAADYERDLRNCLSSVTSYTQCFDRVWNYDLATNKKNAEEALRGQKLQPKFVLGPPIDKKDKLPAPLRDRGVVPGGEKEDEKNPGSGSPKKRP